MGHKIDKMLKLGKNCRNGNWNCAPSPKLDTKFPLWSREPREAHREEVVDVKCLTGLCPVDVQLWLLRPGLTLRPYDPAAPHCKEKVSKEVGDLLLSFLPWRDCDCRRPQWRSIAVRFSQDWVFHLRWLQLFTACKQSHSSVLEIITETIIDYI